MDLGQQITVKTENRVGGCGVLSYLNPTLCPTVYDLATLMIIQSDNAATNELIDLLQMETVNNFMKELGLEHTKLQRKMMDSAAAKAGRDNYTSASDMATSLAFLFRAKWWQPEASEQMLK